MRTFSQTNDTQRLSFDFYSDKPASFPLACLQT